MGVTLRRMPLRDGSDFHLKSDQTGSMRLLRQVSLSVLLLVGMILAASGISSTGAAVGVPDGSSPVMRSAVITPSEWTTYNQNGLRTGVDPSGSSFSTVTAAWTSPTLDGQLYGQPLVAAGRVYAATENDTVYALAADTGPCCGPPMLELRSIERQSQVFAVTSTQRSGSPQRPSSTQPVRRSLLWPTNRFRMTPLIT